MDMNPESRYVLSEVCSFYSQIFTKVDVYRMNTSHTSCYEEEKHDVDLF